jgi:DNA/RNA endonuclease G (NUC1)
LDSHEKVYNNLLQPIEKVHTPWFENQIACTNVVCPANGAMYRVQNANKVLYYSCYINAYNSPLFTVHVLETNTQGIRKDPDPWYTTEFNGNGNAFRNGDYARGHLTNVQDKNQNADDASGTCHILNRVAQTRTSNSGMWR